jgi:hypothetical protein
MTKQRGAPERVRFLMIWDEVWRKIWEIDERYPRMAAPILREIARLCMAAAAECEVIIKKEEEQRER